jgi:hypothetical protein
MASRENQGLHIALILLIMLSVGLCVFLYVFYSRSERFRVEAETARTKAAQDGKALENANFNVQTLKYMVNGGNKTLTQMADDLEGMKGTEGDDATMAQIRKNYTDNMALYGAPDQESESARNYESLPTFLLSRVRDLNQQLADLRNTERDLTAQKAQIETAAAERTKQFEDTANTARKELEAERAKFQADLADLRKQMEGLAGQSTEKDTKITELTAQVEKVQSESEKKITDQATVIGAQGKTIRAMRNESFETADAVVTTVNPKGGVLFVDIGSADYVKPQQTFSVFDKGTTAIMDAKPKGRVEVTQVVGEHVAVCRVLDENVSNIIVPGDMLVSPTWDPGRPMHIAIAGAVKITDDDSDDTALLKNLIELNGGVVDDEVTPQTRYLINDIGREVSEDTAKSGKEESDTVTKVKAATDLGVSQIGSDKFLSLLGWKADVKSLTFGTGSADMGAEDAKAPADGADGGFRKRTPPPARGTDGAF